MKRYLTIFGILGLILTAGLFTACKSPLTGNLPMGTAASSGEIADGAEKALAGTVTVTGYVREASGNGVNSVWVVVTSVPVSNPGNLVAYKAQVETKTVNSKKVYYSVKVPNRGAPETGSILVFSNTYRQRLTYTFHQFNSGETYKFDIVADKLTSAPYINYIGLRESYYGFTRPSVKNWPSDLTPVGSPTLFSYNDRYGDQVEWWCSGAGYNWGQTDNPAPTYVLIVTQTEPCSIIPRLILTHC